MCMQICRYSCTTFPVSLVFALFISCVTPLHITSLWADNGSHLTQPNTLAAKVGGSTTGIYPLTSSNKANRARIIACLKQMKDSMKDSGALCQQGLQGAEFRSPGHMECIRLKHKFLQGLQGAEFSPWDISLGDICIMPTWSKIALFQGFLNFLSDAPKFRSVGAGGICILFEICEKRPFQKCMGLGGGRWSHF